MLSKVPVFCEERHGQADVLHSLDLQKYLELSFDTLDLPVASLE